MKILYFSWVKDKIGKNEEVINISEEINTVLDLINLLVEKNNDYKKAFDNLESLRVSINMQVASFDDKIQNQDEVAFFPPMTGG
tara:strand:+ start:144 stop:395 length:252 start_codon:yes stop_codon:yes gene_type:complete